MKIMKIRGYEQTTAETCMTASLMTLLSKKIEPCRKLELGTFIYALERNKTSLSIGQLDFLAKKYGVGFDFFIESRIVYNKNKILRKSDASPR